MTKVCDKCGREFPEGREDCPRCGSRVSTQKDSVGREHEGVQSQPAAASISNRARNVGIGLIIGIIFLPFIFVWFLLRNGYSKMARIISFAWLVIVIIAVGSNKPSAPVAPEAHQQAQSMPSGQESKQVVELAAGDLFRASEKYNGKIVKIKGTVSNTESIFKKIHKGTDPDAIFNLDGRLVDIPDDETIKKESQIYGIDADLDRSLYPCISLELSGKSRGGTAGMSNFGDILFVFTDNRDVLAKLKLGQKINVVGKVDGTVKNAVIIRNCQLVK
jgi:hypothetical protein